MNSLAATPGAGPGTRPAEGEPAADSTTSVDQSPVAPTVGRDVHHVGRGSADGHYLPDIRAAKITKVHETESVVSLVVWTTEGQFWPGAVPFHGGTADDEPEFTPYYRCPITGLAYPGGTWHWPPRV